MYIGQSNIPSAVTKRESFVIETQLVQDGRADGAASGLCRKFDKRVSMSDHNVNQEF